MSENNGNETAASRIIERTFQASPQQVWAMWTTPEGFESWWAPEGFRIQMHTFEAGPNGNVNFDMIAEAPEVIDVLTKLGLPLHNLIQSRFAVFHPYEQLEFRMLMDFVPDVENYDNVIRVDLIPVQGGVRMVAAMSPTHSEEHTRMCVETLGRQFANMEKQLSVASA